MLSTSGTILGIDSSTGACSIAVCRGDVILAHLHEDMARGQSERLAPMAEAGLATAGIGFPDLDAIAVTRGPGSFTGLRIGMAFAKGLGQALGIPVFGVTGFDAVARAALATEGAAGHGVAVILESRRADLFLQVFTADGAPDGPPVALPPEEIAARLRQAHAAPLVLAGDAADKVLAVLDQQGAGIVRSPVTAPDARQVALIALEMAASGDDPAPIQPLYLRAPDVTAPRAG
ncbi:tRNA (adenosine(37)-N6)-threonylcarbamoyltransferase complex dimerization subunit type 1 TsaB [Nisaea nitritireducens]|uniref:tRNA (adenosine(37)-N6)-threonylcarbamoyltransferase complex dimerization subunit type 1 TsaB n=1 Tax=Nisaea nitritireducens TaxID=568392 RepID=UPI0018676D66|nr:tRNA (adenosine(37)-N6)-threonylcarbamoyltransferase complex dimerization subunit type 1 TsaB [Nisaea nitritireducens]